MDVGWGLRVFSCATIKKRKGKRKKILRLLYMKKKRYLGFICKKVQEKPFLKMIKIRKNEEYGVSLALI